MDSAHDRPPLLDPRARQAFPDPARRRLASMSVWLCPDGPGPRSGPPYRMSASRVIAARMLRFSDPPLVVNTINLFPVSQEPIQCATLKKFIAQRGIARCRPGG